MIELIINGDDFGSSESTNKAIVESFKKGLISSTTLMANMSGFEEACQLIHENKFIDFVGIHMNLTEGVPLTDKIRRISRFCDKEGRFCLSRESPLFSLNLEEEKAVFEELEAQINRCRQKGIPLTHADSHQHIHTEWAIGLIVRRLAKYHKIPYIRLTRNIGSNISFAKISYKWIYNLQLKYAKLSRTQYFGTYDDFVHFQHKEKKINFSCEIMVHPDLNDSNEVIIDKMSFLREKNASSNSDIKVVSFAVPSLINIISQ